MKVLVAEKLAPEGVALLQEEHDVDVRVGMSREEYLAALPEYEALLVRSGVKADAEAIAAGKKLLVIGRAGVGVDNIDIPAATEAGITVVNAPTGNTTAAAEHTIALLFALMRRIPAADASMHAGAWDRSAFMGRELVGKTLGVIGLGKIGMAVADRARALDMQVVGYDPYVTEEAARLHGIERMSVEDILRVADAITVHVPKTKDTANLISTGELATMKPDAVITNVARGGVVDEAALAAALAGGHLASAGLDVFEFEPDITPALLALDNVTLLPHIGSATAECRIDMALRACANIEAFLADGKPLDSCVP